MPSLDSLLASLLRTIALCELQVDSARLALSRQRSYSEEAVARYLDKWGISGVDSGDLQRVLRGLGTECDDREAGAVVAQYDSDGDGKLSKADLKGMLRTTTAPPSSLTEAGYVPGVTSDVLLSLKAFFSQELLYHRLVSRAISALVTLPGFTATDAFRRMDVAGEGGVDRYALEWYLNKEDVVVSGGEVGAVLRRWDRDGDGVVAFREFCEGLRHTMVLIAQKPVTTCQPTTEQPKIDTNPTVKPTPFLTFMVPKLTKPPQVNSQWSYHLEALIFLFKEQITLNRETEHLRELLSQCGDFTLEDGFLFLDRRNTGKITVKDLKYMLDNEECSINGDDGELLLNRYEVDGRVDITAYSDMIEPRTERYRTQLHSHIPQQVRSADRPYLFRSATKAAYLSLLCHLLCVERTVEARKQALALRDFPPSQLYTVIAGESRGFWTVTQVTGSQLKEFLIGNKVAADDADAARIVGWYDGNKDGKVTREEFCTELRPKSNKSYLQI